MKLGLVIYALSLAALLSSQESFACGKFVAKYQFGTWTEVKKWPKLGPTPADRVVTIFVGSRLAPKSEVSKIYQGPTDLNFDQKFPRFNHRVVEIHQTKSKDEVREVIEFCARDSKVLIFENHANPTLIEINDQEKLKFEAKDFIGLKLNHNVVAFSGCNSANETRTCDPNLVEAVMEHTNARAAVGSLRTTHMRTSTTTAISEDLVLAELLTGKNYSLHDLEMLTWHLLLDGGNYLGGGYHPFISLDPTGLDRMAAAFNLPPMSGMPPMEIPDPLETWRILERNSVSQTSP